MMTRQQLITWACDDVDGLGKSVRECEEYTTEELRDLYAADETTEDACVHLWIGGMMYVDVEDVCRVAKVRHVECRKCGKTFDAATDLPEWMY